MIPYTKNIGNKLQLLGFTLTLDSKEIPEGDIDSDLHYEVWTKGAIEVTVEHSPGEFVQVDIVDFVENVRLSSLEKLASLDQVVNS